MTNEYIELIDSKTIRHEGVNVLLQWEEDGKILQYWFPSAATAINISRDFKGGYSGNGNILVHKYRYIKAMESLRYTSDKTEE